MSLVSIQNQLDTLITAIASVATTYKYEPVKVNVTPAVAIILGPSNEIVESNRQDKLNGNFVLRCIVERTTDDATQTAKLMGLVDDVLAVIRLDSNRCISGAWQDISIDGISPVIGAEKGDVKILYVEILVGTKAFIDVT